VQTLKVSTSIERSVSWDSNSVSNGLCERTVQSIHPTADYGKRDRYGSRERITNSYNMRVETESIKKRKYKENNTNNEKIITFA